MVLSIINLHSRLVEDIPSIGLARVGRELELSRQKELVSELGLVGDDAFEFMGKYASYLNVEKGDYDSSSYFDAEGLWLLLRFRKRKAKMRITLGMLELAARDGEWDSAKLGRAYLNDSYQ